jgi:hypothetical protein
MEDDINSWIFHLHTSLAHVRSHFLSYLSLSPLAPDDLHAGKAVGKEHVVGEVNEEHIVGGVGDEHVVGDGEPILVEVGDVHVVGDLVADADQGEAGEQVL